MRSLFERPVMPLEIKKDGIEMGTYGERESSKADGGITKENKDGIKCGCGKAEGCTRYGKRADDGMSEEFDHRRGPDALWIGGRGTRAGWDGSCPSFAGERLKAKTMIRGRVSQRREYLLLPDGKQLRVRPSVP